MVKVTQEGYFNLLGIGDGTKAAALQNITSAIVLKYFFPPKNCEQAVATLNLLKNDLDAEQKRIAGGGTTSNQYRGGLTFLTGVVGLLITKVSGKDIDNTIVNSYQQQIKRFEDWISQAKCLENALDMQDTAFANQISDALNKQYSTDKSTQTTDSLIIYGVLGILAIGAFIILLKK